MTQQVVSDLMRQNHVSPRGCSEGPRRDADNAVLVSCRAHPHLFFHAYRHWRQSINLNDRRDESANLRQVSLLLRGEWGAANRQNDQYGKDQCQAIEVLSPPAKAH